LQGKTALLGLAVLMTGKGTHFRSLRIEQSSRVFIKGTSVARRQFSD